MYDEIKHIRIDGRLIHGQVVTKWIYVVEVDRIILIDDTLLNNLVEKNALKISTPSNIKLSLLGTEKALKNIQNKKYKDQNVMILVKTPKPLRALVENGLDINKINIGNIYQRKGAKQIRPSVFLGEEDIKDLTRLIELKVKVNIQTVSSKPKENIEDILKNFKLEVM